MTNQGQCPACSYMMSSFDKDCPRCHGKGLPKPAPVQNATPAPAPVIAVSAPAPTPIQNKKSQAASVLGLLGGLLLIGGLVIAGYYFAVFDTSVEVPSSTFLGQTFGGGRVNNIGLLNQRTNGILMGFGAAVVGAILLVVDNGQRGK